MDIDLKKVAIFAADAHRGQFRIGSYEPYVCHSVRVALAAQRHGFSDEVQAAALLHDVVEDTPVKIYDLAEFGPRVCQLVALLTKKSATADMGPADYAAYYKAICADREAAVLKLLDRTDNLHSMRPLAATSKSWVKNYQQKTIKAFGPIVAAARAWQVEYDYWASLRMIGEALEAA